MARLLGKAAELVGVLLFATMFGAFLLQVVMRYAVNRPLGWTEELSLVAYVWGIFWACAFMAGRREHVAFDLLYAGLPDRGKRLCAVAGTVLVGGLFAAALPATYDYVTFMARERTSVLGLRFDLVFGGFLLFVLAVTAGAARRLVRLAGRGWRDEL